MTLKAGPVAASGLATATHRFGEHRYADKGDLL